MTYTEKLNQLVNQGYTYYQARYACDKSRGSNAENYKPRPRKDKTPEQMEELGVTIEPADNEYGWNVYRHGKKKAIWVAKGTQYKSGGCKYFPAIAITHKGKQACYSLSSLIWLCYLKKEIPAGYVIDHIDNDSFNNDPDNLQMLTIRENIVKNPSKKLYNMMKKKELEDMHEVDLVVKSKTVGIPVDEVEELLTK